MTLMVRQEAKAFMDAVQAMTATEVRARWPQTFDIVHEGLALGEEAGEVLRAILKRDEGTRGTPEEWSAEIKKEVGQAMMVLFGIADLEGFSLIDAMAAAFDALLAKPLTEPAFPTDSIGTFDRDGHVDLGGEG